MNKARLVTHLLELKARILHSVIFFIFSFAVAYYFSAEIYQIILMPLVEANDLESRKIIYTHLTEAFFTYINLSLFTAFLATIPVLSIQIYRFIAPGLYKIEKIIAFILLLFSPILFYLGAFFVFKFIMPKAWMFFLSYENLNSSVPIVMEAKISEYLGLVLQLIIGFGVAFQLPIFFLIGMLIGVIDHNMLRKNRRIALVVIFILAAILTPPDVISQIALAVPMVLLYEISIIACKIFELKVKRKC